MTSKIIQALGLAALVAGCAGNKAYRPVSPSIPQPPEQPWAESVTDAGQSYVSVSCVSIAEVEARTHDRGLVRSTAFGKAGANILAYIRGMRDSSESQSALRGQFHGLEIRDWQEVEDSFCMKVEAAYWGVQPARE